MGMFGVEATDNQSSEEMNSANAVVIAILLCRHKRKSPPGGGTEKYGHNKSSPDSGYPNDDSHLVEQKAFYENLPFHGLNPPGKKSGILGGKNPGGLVPVDDKECIYADCDEDYKDNYEFGPVAYHNASREAAAKKKESLEC